MNRFSIWVALLAVIMSGCSMIDTKTQPTTKKQSVRLNKSLAQTASTSNAPVVKPKLADKPTVKPPVTDSKKTPPPVNVMSGKVATFNSAGRFVVLDFSAGKLPALEQTMNVYRDGKKVGEVKVSGPTRDNNTVADLVSGDARKGDEVRDR